MAPAAPQSGSLSDAFKGLINEEEQEALALARLKPAPIPNPTEQAEIQRQSKQHQNDLVLLRMTVETRRDKLQGIIAKLTPQQSPEGLTAISEQLAALAIEFNAYLYNPQKHLYTVLQKISQQPQARSVADVAKAIAIQCSKWSASPDSYSLIELKIEISKAISALEGLLTTEVRSAELSAPS